MTDSVTDDDLNQTFQIRLCHSRRPVGLLVQFLCNFPTSAFSPCLPSLRIVS